MCRVIGRGQYQRGEAALGQIIMLHAAVIAGWTWMDHEMQATNRFNECK